MTLGKGEHSQIIDQASSVPLGKIKVVVLTLKDFHGQYVLEQ